MPKKILATKTPKPIQDMTQNVQKQLAILQNGIINILNSSIPETSLQELCLITGYL